MFNSFQPVVKWNISAKSYFKRVSLVLLKVLSMKSEEHCSVVL